jgi:hypothetical protein
MALVPRWVSDVRCVTSWSVLSSDPILTMPTPGAWYFSWWPSAGAKAFHSSISSTLL